MVFWGALALTGYTRISLPQIHFRAKSSESILVVLECLIGHLVSDASAPPCPAGLVLVVLHLFEVNEERVLQIKPVFLF